MKKGKVTEKLLTKMNPEELVLDYLPPSRAKFPVHPPDKFAGVHSPELNKALLAHFLRQNSKPRSDLPGKQVAEIAEKMASKAPRKTIKPKSGEIIEEVPSKKRAKSAERTTVVTENLPSQKKSRVPKKTMGTNPTLQTAGTTVKLVQNQPQVSHVNLHMNFFNVPPKLERVQSDKELSYSAAPPKHLPKAFKTAAEGAFRGTRTENALPNCGDSSIFGSKPGRVSSDTQKCFKQAKSREQSSRLAESTSGFKKKVHPFEIRPEETELEKSTKSLLEKEAKKEKIRKKIVGTGKMRTPNSKSQTHLSRPTHLGSRSPVKLLEGNYESGETKTRDSKPRNSGKWTKTDPLGFKNESGRFLSNWELSADAGAKNMLIRDFIDRKSDTQDPPREKTTISQGLLGPLLDEWRKFQEEIRNFWQLLNSKMKKKALVELFENSVKEAEGRLSKAFLETALGLQMGRFGHMSDRDSLRQHEGYSAKLGRPAAQPGTRRTVSDVIDFFWPKTETENRYSPSKVKPSPQKLEIEDCFCFQVDKVARSERSSVLLAKQRGSGVPRVTPTLDIMALDAENHSLDLQPVSHCQGKPKTTGKRFVGPVMGLYEGSSLSIDSQKLSQLMNQQHQKNHIKSILESVPVMREPRLAIPLPNQMATGVSQSIHMTPQSKKGQIPRRAEDHPVCPSPGILGQPEVVWRVQLESAASDPNVLGISEADSLWEKSPQNNPSIHLSESKKRGASGSKRSLSRFAQGQVQEGRRFREENWRSPRVTREKISESIDNVSGFNSRPAPSLLCKKIANEALSRADLGDNFAKNMTLSLNNFEHADFPSDWEGLSARIDLPRSKSCAYLQSKGGVSPEWPGEVSRGRVEGVFSRHPSRQGTSLHVLPSASAHLNASRNTQEVAGGVDCIRQSFECQRKALLNITPVKKKTQKSRRDPLSAEKSDSKLGQVLLILDPSQQSELPAGGPVAQAESSYLPSVSILDANSPKTGRVAPASELRGFPGTSPTARDDPEDKAPNTQMSNSDSFENFDIFKLLEDSLFNHLVDTTIEQPIWRSFVATIKALEIPLVTAEGQVSHATHPSHADTSHTPSKLPPIELVPDNDLQASDSTQTVYAIRTHYRAIDEYLFMLKEQILTRGAIAIRQLAQSVLIDSASHQFARVFSATPEEPFHDPHRHLFIQSPELEADFAHLEVQVLVSSPGELRQFPQR